MAPSRSNIILNADTSTSAGTLNRPAAAGGRRSGPTITPIIRIVHVHAPTLICTDVANFRTLVQEMTGNVSHNISCKHPLLQQQQQQEEEDDDSSMKSSNTGLHSTHHELEASGETDNCAEQTLTTSSCTAARNMVVKRRHRSSRMCRRSTIASVHNRAAATTVRARGDSQDGDEENDEEDDDDEDHVSIICDSPATSAVSSCEAGKISREYAGYRSRLHSDSVEGFFAADHESNAALAETACAAGGQLITNCSAYLPVGWRPAYNNYTYDIPGGFDYFSF